MKNTSKKEGGYIKLENERIMLIELPSKNMFWDVGSFRPDINSKIQKGVRHKAKVIFAEENLPSGKLIIFPRQIHVKGNNYVNVR